MINSRSQSRINKSKELSRSYCRSTYFNEEISNRRDNSTIFHSPYKNGQKNKDYTNPSFMSSHLFYPQTALTPKIKHNVIKNTNQQKQQDLYLSRMQKAEQRRNRMQEAQKSKSKQLGRSRSCRHLSKSVKMPNEREQLVKELRNLINYRQKQEKINHKLQMKEENVPIYCDRHKVERQQRVTQQRSREMKDWIKATNKLNNFKEELCKENKEKQKKLVNHSILMNEKKYKQRQQETRRKAGLLSQILKEQIRQYKANYR